MRGRFLPYDPWLKEIARKLRNTMTVAEIMLWQRLKGKQMRGYDFHRQKPIDHYVVDFFCPRLKLVLEIDGISHEGKLEQDEKRQKDLEEYDLTFLRFDDLEVKRNLDGVVAAIEEWIIDHERRANAGRNIMPLRPLKQGL